ncbi:MAG TPA: VWA domain-containing protein, partial [Planctomycetota bacterium]|nr:VWA domain-containing protein [Planctomycetota bacterium]
LSPRRRLILRSLRIVVALLILFALLRPAVSYTRREERLPVVAMLIDDSASMAFPDARENPLLENNSPDRRTRFDTARIVVQKLQEKLTLTHRVKLFTFSDSLKLLAELPHRDSENTPPLVRDAILPPEHRPVGDYSNIGDALKDSLRELSADRISGLVLLSDGRETDGASKKDAADALAAVQVPVHAVALGSEFPLRDLRIDEVVAATEASLGDVLGFHVKITNQISAPLNTELTLFEQGKKVAAKTLTLPRGESMVTIGTIPETEGVREFRLVLPKYPDEINTENNEAAVQVSIVKRTLRVLLIAGVPTREYFYLVPALLRDPVIDLSCYLQSADVDYVQQGKTQLERLPQTTDDWSRYDVAVLYDVDPNGITTQQIAGLEAMVNKGGGLLVIAGIDHGLAKLVQVHAAKIRGLLPVEIDKNQLPDYDRVYDKPLKIERTPIGKTHPIMLASSNEQLNEKIWASFPTFYWSHPVQSAKPKAITLLFTNSDGSNTAVMAIHRYGEGAVLLSAINGLWRWRFPGESFDYDRFWSRAIRYLGETRLKGTQQQVALSTDRRSYSPGEDVQINLRLLDPALLNQLSGQQLYASISTAQEPRPQGSGNTTRTDDEMIPLKPDATGTPVYRGDYRARRTGSMQIRATAHAPDADSETKPLFDIAQNFLVKLEPLEDRDTSADLDGMKALAECTGGKYFDYRNMKEIDTLTAAIPKDPQILTQSVVVEVWDGTIFLALFLVLICAEWSFRKWWGLL